MRCSRGELKMSDFKVRLSGLDAVLDEHRRMSSLMTQYSNDVDRVKNSLSMQVRQRSGIDARLSKVAQDIRAEHSALTRMANAGQIIYMMYQSTERSAAGMADVQTVPMQSATPVFDVNVPASSKSKESKWDVFAAEFAENYGLAEVLAGAGYIGDVYGFLEDVKDGKNWADFAKSGVDAYEFLSGANKTLKNYKKISNAVGKKQAAIWCAKSVTGLKPLGRPSAAKNPIKRFKNNLTNKTSPFNFKTRMKDVMKDFTGANGVGKAVASWGAVALDGVTNWFDNKEEQARSNGTMSDARVVAETVTETAVGTALAYASGVVVGAAVTAAAGTVAAPGVVILAVSGAVTAAAEAGFKALTGESITEWASDTILDAGKAVGDGIKKAAKSVGKWFKKLAFA